MSRNRERNRHMKISVQDVSHVNWEKVKGQLDQECADAVTAAVEEAQATLAKLKPGERKTLTVKVGSITVARPR
jgi:hypothetical protein